jgi:hypothetical protein
MSSNPNQGCPTRNDVVPPESMLSHPNRCRPTRIDVVQPIWLWSTPSRRQPLLNPTRCGCNISSGSLVLSLGYGMVIVAVGGGCCVDLNVVSGELMRKGWEKTNHDEDRGSFSRRTGWDSHFMSQLLTLVAFESSERKPPHPSGKGRGGLDSHFGSSLLFRNWALLVLMWFVTLALGGGADSWIERTKK